MNQKPMFLGFTVSLLLSFGAVAQDWPQSFEVPYDSSQRYLAVRAVELQFYPAEKDRKEKAQIRADIVCQSVAKDEGFRAAHYTTARNIWFPIAGFKFYNFSQGYHLTEIYDYPRCRTCTSDQTWRFFNQPGWWGHYTHYFTSIVCTNRRKT